MLSWTLTHAPTSTHISMKALEDMLSYSSTRPQAVHFQCLHRQGASSDALAKTKTDYDAFLADAARLAAVKEAATQPGLSDEQAKVLAIMEKTFK